MFGSPQKEPLTTMQDRHGGPLGGDFQAWFLKKEKTFKQKGRRRGKEEKALETEGAKCPKIKTPCSKLSLENSHESLAAGALGMKVWGWQEARVRGSM